MKRHGRGRGVLQFDSRGVGEGKGALFTVRILGWYAAILVLAAVLQTMSQTLSRQYQQEDYDGGEND